MPSPMSRSPTLGDEALHVGPTTDKLRFLKSPIHPEDVVDDSSGTASGTTSTITTGLTRPSNPPEVARMGYRYNPEDFPLLRRNEDATNLEVFYDLFLAVGLSLKGVLDGSLTIFRPCVLHATQMTWLSN